MVTLDDHQALDRGSTCILNSKTFTFLLCFGSGSNISNFFCLCVTLFVRSAAQDSRSTVSTHMSHNWDKSQAGISQLQFALVRCSTANPPPNPLKGSRVFVQSIRFCFFIDCPVCLQQTKLALVIC